ncbi:MAG: hypothetical protein AB1896_09870, partial [Thermodesulfobacteriota bacterium]
MSAADWPDWVNQLKRMYLAGSSSFFILHGNVDDVVLSFEAGQSLLETLPDFLARRLFGGYDLVLHYDLGRGLRVHPGGDPARLTRMNALLERLTGQGANLPKDPTQVLRLLDRLVTLILVNAAGSRPLKAALLFDYGEMICPPGDQFDEHLAVFLNWARSPVVKRVNMVFILLAHSLGGLHPLLVQSAHTAEIRVPMPELETRTRFIERLYPGADHALLGRLSSGLTLSNLDNFLRL